ncbi:MAG: sigma factor [Candidatus Nanoarchaeia archaeon]|nr:sigma factor [Candidatus Nanoarchaeia archaeon]
MKNLNFIRSIAWSFNKTTGLPYDELFSEASLAYLEAELKYKPNSKATFETFAKKTITNALVDFCKEEQKQKHLSLDDVITTVYDSLITETVYPEEENNFSKDVKEVIQTIFAAPEEFADVMPKFAKGLLFQKLRNKGFGIQRIKILMKKTRIAVREMENFRILYNIN